jgi:hypothetical protein
MSTIVYKMKYITVLMEKNLKKFSINLEEKLTLFFLQKIFIIIQTL